MGAVRLLAQFLGVCMVVVGLMLVDTLLDALFFALTRSRVATQICSAAVFVAVVAALFSVWVSWSLGLVLTSVVSALVVLLFSKLATERYAALLGRDG